MVGAVVGILVLELVGATAAVVCFGIALEIDMGWGRSSMEGWGYWIVCAVGGFVLPMEIDKQTGLVEVNRS